MYGTPHSHIQKSQNTARSFNCPHLNLVEATWSGICTMNLYPFYLVATQSGVSLTQVWNPIINWIRCKLTQSIEKFYTVFFRCVFYISFFIQHLWIYIIDCSIFSKSWKDRLIGFNKDIRHMYNLYAEKNTDLPNQ